MFIFGCACVCVCVCVCVCHYLRWSDPASIFRPRRSATSASVDVAAFSPSSVMLWDDPCCARCPRLIEMALTHTPEKAVTVAHAALGWFEIRGPRTAATNPNSGGPSPRKCLWALWPFIRLFVSLIQRWVLSDWHPHRRVGLQCMARFASDRRRCHHRAVCARLWRLWQTTPSPSCVYVQMCSQGSTGSWQRFITQEPRCAHPEGCASVPPSLPNTTQPPPPHPPPIPRASHELVLLLPRFFLHFASPPDTIPTDDWPICSDYASHRRRCAVSTHDHSSPAPASTGLRFEERRTDGEHGSGQWESARARHPRIANRLAG